MPTFLPFLWTGQEPYVVTNEQVMTPTGCVADDMRTG